MAEPKSAGPSGARGFLPVPSATPAKETFAHHQLGVLDGVEGGAFPEVVAAHPEGEAVVERGVDPDAADAALHLAGEVVQ